MIDVSDGLAADVGHICERSRLGVEFASRVRCRGADGVDGCRAAGPALEPDALALGGGDDYELADRDPRRPGDARSPRRSRRPPVTPIGELGGGRASVVGSGDGARRPLAGLGWDHFGSDA